MYMLINVLVGDRGRGMGIVPGRGILQQFSG